MIERKEETKGSSRELIEVIAERGELGEILRETKLLGVINKVKNVAVII